MNILKFPKLIFQESKLKSGYSTPILMTGYGTWYYLCDRNPTASEPDCYTDMPDFIYFWFNQTNGSYWRCRDNTAGAMKWQNDHNGIQRDFVETVSPAFNTIYQPSTTNDCLISASLSLTSALLGASDIVAQVDVGLGNGYVTRAEAGISGAVITLKNTLTFPVPTGASFKLFATNGAGASSSILRVETLIL